MFYFTCNYGFSVSAHIKQIKQKKTIIIIIIIIICTLGSKDPDG